MLVSRRARAERFPWPVHLDEFRLAGRVVRTGRPDVWIYEHLDNGGSLCADAAGDTYRFVATPRSEGVGQFRRCELRTALWRARLPDVVDRVWYERPAAGGDDAGAGRPSGAGDGGRRAARVDGSTGAGVDRPAAAGGDRPAAARGDRPAAAGSRRPAVRRGHLTLVAG